MLGILKMQSILGLQLCIYVHKINAYKFGAEKKPRKWKPAVVLVRWDCDFFNSLKILVNAIVLVEETF